MDRFANRFAMAACVLLLGACEGMSPFSESPLPDVKLGADGEAVKTQLKADADYVADETSANAEIIGGNIERAGSRIANNVRDQVKKTNRKVRDWWLTPLPPDPEPRVVASSYCYRVMQDIVCYRDPMPGWEQRLVAYQGTHAESPPAAMTRPLPTIKVDPTKTTAYRVNNAKPVFVSLPPEEQKKQETVDGVSVIDESRENLPNAAAVPQL